MFSEVAHHHRQHLFPQLSSPLYHHGLKDFPQDVLPSGSPLGQQSPVQNASFRQRSEMPKQHARPLRNTAALPQQLPMQTPYLPSSESSEHMLRRKTPNGTLAAGYDGSPVEWTKRPHAVKHFLTPTSNESGPSTLAFKPTDNSNDHTSLHRDRSLESRVGEQLRLQPRHTDLPGERLQTSALTVDAQPKAGWRSTAVPSGGIDSVLNQASVYHHNYNLAGSQHIPTVLQPMWPPCLGPTSIHSPGPCGPYWPDGAFEPYRPAPVQDPRFQDRNAQQSADYSAQIEPAVNTYGQWLQAHSELQYPPLPDQSILPGQFIGRQREGLVSPNTKHSPLSRRSSIPGGQPATMPQHHTPLAYRNRVSPWQDSSAPIYSETPYNTGMQRSGLPVSPLSCLQRSISPTSNAQFKEKILVWAHRIYGSLLASIEQARRYSMAEQHGIASQHQSNFYPRPPRRPYPSWSNSHSRDMRSHITSKGSVHTQTRADVDRPDKVLEASRYDGQSSPGDQATLVQSSLPSQSLLSTGQPKQRWQSRDGSLRGHSFVNQPSYVPSYLASDLHASSPSAAAIYAIEMLGRLCQESGLEWTDGMLLTGCLAYGLSDYNKAMKWYLKVLQQDPNNVEAMSNLAATLLALNRREDAEHYWFRSVKLRPSYFEAIEHLIGLLHEGHRGREAVKVIEYVEHALREDHSVTPTDQRREIASNELPAIDSHQHGGSDSTTFYGFGSSGYAIPPLDNGRMLALVHGKGNMLYQLGDNAGAAQAFENAILIGAGRRHLGIQGLIKNILSVFFERSHSATASPHRLCGADEPVLLTPDMALETSRLVFPPNGRLPGLEGVPDGFSQKAAISIVSNSLLSLAKIYQDGMSSSGATATAPRATSGVQEILALYYLSLSLQPSPSTANNVGILLASVQQSARSKLNGKLRNLQPTTIPGVTPGSGVALALAYYDYGLKLDTRHAHLYTNLGSLFKDIGQLQAAIKMYEKAVECDGNFDIALANLANAVKDQGRVSDAIVYYKRAVSSNPDFAEAVCGLANALNSVCNWSGRGGIHHLGSDRDRWHVDEHGDLFDSKKSTVPSCGWISRVVAIVEKQLHDGEGWGRGVLRSVGIDMFQNLTAAALRFADIDKNRAFLRSVMEDWAGHRWEGAKVVRFVERATKNLVRQIYLHEHVDRRPLPPNYRLRPQLPAALAVPSAPTVLPFHTFTCPLSAKQIRKISQRNGLRVSCSTLRAPWLSAQVYDPPPPPDPFLNVGYISSDFNNHPLAHLMQSVFGMHDRSRVKAFCYATTAGDGSAHRQQIEREAPVFHDASSWSIDRLVSRVVADGIHILINLNGYTRGARNEVFAARPAPIQMSFMGFAGTLGAEWCDYLLADRIAIPPQTLRPWRANVDLIDQTKDGNNDDDQDDWVYGENIIFTKDTFFCCDHRQSAPDSQEAHISWVEEQRRRWTMRKELFPELPDDAVILGNFNQLYKVRLIPCRNWQSANTL